ncbi:YebC/PmpR family DNA-binding transcriptional regulator [Candidatus Uhrbacteria bacterium]|jgi:YebC/PmpR family DNA-binding regulatory protein|nr:YebC/PmpR family DNA-binding transcriptional regulator [Candidatus Uhrbacteria bacterium]
MSGHSKWHNIQKKKGLIDAKRGQVFTKLAKSITIAAKDGGGADMNFNFQLRVAVDAAKSANMPKDNIERAIKRGTGEGSDGGVIEEIIYEGYGPGGSALLIQCLTDNRNRSNAEVRTVMKKNGGNPGEQGSVMWMFDQKGVIVINATIDDALELALIDAGAEDIKQIDEVVEVVTEVRELKNVLDVIKGLELNVEGAGLEYLAKETLVLNEEDRGKLEELVELLDELDDVDTVFTNEA